MICDNNKKNFDLFVCVLVVVSSFVGLLGATNLPGIYLDAVNPDYLSVQMLYPQPDRVSWAIPNWGFPILGQVYHGVFTAYIMAIVIKLVGSTSVVLLHAVNTCYGMIICLGTYRILNKININKYIAALVTLSLSCMPALFLSYRTQFYIELPGIMFMTFAIDRLVNWSSNRENKNLFLAGLFAGISVYCYYNLVFVFLAYILIILVEEKKELFESKLNCLLTWGSGVALGIILYVVGYTEILFFDSPNRWRVMALIIIVYLSWIVIMLMSVKRKKKFLYIMSFLITGIFVYYAFKNFMPILLSNFSDGISKEKISFVKQVCNQINSVSTYLKNMISDASNEYLVFGYEVSKYNLVYLYTVISGTFITFIIWLYRSIKYKKIDNKALFYSWISVLTYLLIAFVFAKSRLQAQHFVPMIIILSIELAIELDYIYDFVKGKSIKNIVFSLVCVVLISTCLLNAYNSRKIIKELDKTGGNNLCTEEINNLAEFAKKNYYAGKKELYVFEDWGFMCGFDFLTSNLVAYTTDSSVEYLQAKQKEGYEIIVCCWNVETSNEYINKFKDANMKTYFETMNKRNGDVGFYKICLE